MVTPTTDTIADNTSTSFTTHGSWVGPYTGQGYANTVHFAPTGDGSRTANWHFAVVPGQTYRVSATWSPYRNRATDAPYTVSDDTGVLATTRLDQQQAPDDYEVDGANWEQVATVTPTGEVLTVTLSNDANGYVIADAVQVEMQ